MTQEQLKRSGYIKKEKSIIANKSFKISLIITVIIGIVTFSAFLFINKGPYNEFNSPWTTYLEVLVIVIAGLFLHEFLHCMLFSIFSEEGWKSIRYGFEQNVLKFYSYSIDGVTKTQYIIARILPLIITFIIPFIISTIINNVIIAIASVALLQFCGFDIISLALILKEDKNDIYFNSKEDCGCIIYKKGESKVLS